LSLLYTGTITNWNDQRLVVDNPWLSSCNVTVRLVRRSDDGAATEVFQDYLSKENPQWNVFKRDLVTQWPQNNFACAGKQDPGMIQCIASQRGAIGYVDMAQARTSGLPEAAIQNVTKSFVSPTPAGCSAAAAASPTPTGTTPTTVGGTQVPWVPGTLGDWSTASITYAPDSPSSPAKSYPICAFSYVFLLQTWSTGYGATMPGGVARATVDYFVVALMDSTQAALAAAGYAPLPPNVLATARAGIDSVSYFNVTTAGI
jgi:phosphate transport system substrate-binding protein